MRVVPEDFLLLGSLGCYRFPRDRRIVSKEPTSVRLTIRSQMKNHRTESAETIELAGAGHDRRCCVLIADQWHSDCRSTGCIRKRTIAHANDRKPTPSCSSYGNRALMRNEVLTVSDCRFGILREPETGRELERVLCPCLKRGLELRRKTSGILNRDRADRLCRTAHFAWFLSD
jgi:hypothetical protein